MGVVGLWPLLKKKGYDPNIHYRSIKPSNPPGQIRIDLLGTIFITIQKAYSTHPLQLAHHIVEKEIEKFGTRTDLILYLDGSPSVEKNHITVRREEVRKKALGLAEE
ncbi:hypothetical protein BGZ76_007768, partial [Entomortierella beljakovae]